MTKKKTHEQYVAELSEKNPCIEVIGLYVNNKTNILHRCKIDGCEWMVCPHNLLRGSGCPVCGARSSANKRLKTHEQYIKEVAKVNNAISVIGKYIDDSTKILHKCDIDGCEWCAKPTNILNGKGCPRCSKNERYGHDGYIKRVNEINPDIDVVGKYVNAKTKILHRCKIDGHEWNVAPNDVLRGHGCPKCNTASIGEKTIATWFDKNKIPYEPQKTFSKCRDKYVLPFDFYLPDYNMAIEYNGRQHYEPVDYFGGEEAFEYTVKHDKIKENYCKENNIRLFTIPYFEDINMKLKELDDLIITKEVAA